MNKIVFLRGILYRVVEGGICFLHRVSLFPRSLSFLLTLSYHVTDFFAPAPPGFRQFDPIRAWELAHLSLLVHDHDTFGTNELLCGASIELRALRRGLRFVPLRFVSYMRGQ